MTRNPATPTPAAGATPATARTRTRAASSILDRYSLFDDDRRDYVPTEDFERFLSDIEAEARASVASDTEALLSAVEPILRTGFATSAPDTITRRLGLLRDAYEKARAALAASGRGEPR